MFALFNKPHHFIFNLTTAIEFVQYIFEILLFMELSNFT
jgi:hypothetical protein